MSRITDDPVPYRVSYSGRVQQRFRELIAEARARGEAGVILAALKEFDRRLRIYPQFGDPLSDLRAEVGQLRLGLVPPLAMRYGVPEERRTVLVTVPPMLLSRRGGQ